MICFLSLFDLFAISKQYEMNLIWMELRITLLYEFMSKKTLGNDQKQGGIETKAEKKTCKICFRVLSSAQAVRRHSLNCKAENYFPQDENDNNDTIEVEDIHEQLV